MVAFLYFSVFARWGLYQTYTGSLTFTLIHILRQTIKKCPLFEANYYTINPLPRSPRAKVRGPKWSARTRNFLGHNLKNCNIFHSDRFLQNVLRDFWFFQKIKNGPFSGPIYHQIHLDRVKKAYTLMISMETQKKCTSQIFDFWKFITHFLKWSEEHFSKCLNMWINENLSTRSRKLTEIFSWKGLSG